MKTLDRFLKYISIDTTSNPKSEKSPTSCGQIHLAEELYEELLSLNLDSIHVDKDNCYIYALLKGNGKFPSIGFVSHLDTSNASCGNNINPKIINNYDGKDVNLNDNVTLSTKQFPDLKKHKGKTLITTDGNTLLGADDKAGIAEIMEMLEYFSSNNVEHGDIYVCFTPDEEIGRGTDNLNLDYFHPDIAYTVDGSDLGELSYENFNAARVDINIKGVSSHVGTAKGNMINAVRIASIINELLPYEIPEETENYDGFYHLEEISGDVNHAYMRYLIRDFDKRGFEKRKNVIKKIVDQLNKMYNNSIDLEITDTYYNMYDVVKDNMGIVDITTNAMKDVNVSCNIKPVRGGTDGADISFMGIPCPNLGTGGHNFHSIYEYICLEDMEKVCELLISIVKAYTKDKNLSLLKK